MSIQLKEIKSTEWGLDIENLGEVKQGLDDIKQCVYIILTTQKQSDPLREDFGCGAYDYVDQPVNKAIPNMISSILEALEKYEKRIEDVKVKSSIDISTLVFTVTYKIKNTILTDLLNVSYGFGNT
jgi:phage baseplate assembly protein W